MILPSSVLQFTVAIKILNVVSPENLFLLFQSKAHVLSVLLPNVVQETFPGSIKVKIVFPFDSELGAETFHVTLSPKQTKSAAGPNTTKVATQPYQGLSIDFSFTGTTSKDKE